MKKFIACLFLMGCAEGEYSVPSDAAPPTHTPEGGLCCQIINNDSADPYWNNKRWTCSDYDPAALNFPWVCNSGSDAETTCEDINCLTGSTCLGVGGTGIVLDCDSQDWSDW